MSMGVSFSLTYSGWVSRTKRKLKRHPSFRMRNTANAGDPEGQPSTRFVIDEEAVRKHWLKEYANDTPKSEPKTKPKPAKPQGYTEDFETFWKAYPKKLGKKAAYTSWQKIDPDAKLLELILQAVVAQSGTQDWQKQHGQFIPHPNTWLNNERWNDELETIPTGFQGPKGREFR